MKERKHNKFADAFNAPSVKLLQIHDIIFVMVNSMAMEGDGCNICTEAMTKLRDIKWKLKCAKVIVLPLLCFELLRKCINL